MNFIEEILSESFRVVGITEPLIITRSDRPDLADYQCNVAFIAARRLGKKPQDIAQAIVDATEDHRVSLSVAGPGFLNISVANSELTKTISLPKQPKSKNELVFLDYGGPNVAKAMHVGHMRSLIIGSSLTEILRWRGYDVITDIHWGDWGFQMGLVLAGLMSDGFADENHQHPYTIEHLQDLYPKAAAFAKENTEFKSDAHDLVRRLQSGEEALVEMWQKILDATEADVLEDLKTMNVSFDLYNGESSVVYLVMPVLEQLQNLGLVVNSDGAEVIPCGDDLPPLIWLSRDGAFLYGATDVATLVERAKAPPSKVIYVVDQRQELHFRQVFSVAGQLGITADLIHAGFGTVNGPDGKPLKTRAGGVPRLREMLDEAIEKALEKNPDPEIARKVAMAAIKFADLQNKRLTSYTYDIKKAIAFEGKTGPYLLYQNVRMKSILAKQTVGIGLPDIKSEEERQIALALLDFGNLIQKCEEQLAPHFLADYLYNLAQLFSAYYGKQKIKDDPSRLGLIWYLQQTFELGLELLGIEIVEEM